MPVAHIQKAIRWLGGREPLALISILAVVAGVWGFIELADEVLEGDTQAFDRWTVQVLRDPQNAAEPIGPRWLAEMGRDATGLGGTGFLTLMSLIVAGYLWIDRKYGMLMFLLVAVPSGWLVSSLLKGFFQRPRPDLVPHLSHVYTTSFPSGHSMMSAVVYLTLGTLLSSVIKQRALKIYVLSIALLLTFLVGISRVFLGVHYPTDVLAGWTAGLVWALLCWLTARGLYASGQVELEPAPGEAEASRER